MTKMFCDRCGKEIERKDHRNICAWIAHRCIYATLKMVSHADESSFNSENAYVCPECEESYVHWFMNPEL